MCVFSLYYSYSARKLMPKKGIDSPFSPVLEKGGGRRNRNGEERRDVNTEQEPNTDGVGLDERNIGIFQTLLNLPHILVYYFK